MFRSRTVATAVTVVALTASANMICPLESQARDPLVPGAEPSPSGCTIAYITNPHFAKSVPGAVKVNVRAECDVPVPEHDLSVTSLADDEPIVKTSVRSTNKAFVMNQGTYIRCTNFTDQHEFQGAALGTSWEDDKPYIQIDTGPKITLGCGF